MARKHEDDLVDDAERRAYAKVRRAVMAQFLEDWRANNFGFLTASENELAKQLIRHVGITERNHT